MNLRELIRDVLDETDLTQPQDVSEEALSRIPPDQYGAVLQQILSIYVREVIRTERNTVVVQPATGTSSAKSIREAWKAHLRDRIHVGDGTWRLLGDCGYDDLIAAADERQANADRNLAQARRYRAMADAVKEGGVEKFSDLPLDTQAALLR